MKSLLAREALPAAACSNCEHKLARWRCRDCMFPSMQCRKCFRKLHQHEPFHRLECWTGKYFRPAAMWEVGGYVLIKHHGEIGLCKTLKFQKDHLDDIQSRQDSIDQDICRAVTADGTAGETIFQTPTDIEMNWGAENDQGRPVNDDNTDKLILSEMDKFYAEKEGDDDQESDEMLREDDNEEGEKDCDDEAYTGFTNYMGSISSGGLDSAADMNPIGDNGANLGSSTTEQFQSAPPPKRDAFNNHYVRIAHTNGIHHLAVITCTCRAVDDIPIDLMYSRLVPTSFTRIRTLFTTMALDSFRLANLEMKASAYQYFQFIHRLTSKTTSNIPNLYPDLRKLSRAWRWMKKLKWAGFGHKTADVNDPAAGELSIFCPACPQPGVNLPTDWKNDENRYLK